jgi:hypothetical protein
MFRFTIREFLLVTLIVGMSLTWFADRSNLHAALAASKHERELLEWVRNDLEKDIDSIGEQLPEHGLALWHACGFPPIVAPAKTP